MDSQGTTRNAPHCAWWPDNYSLRQRRRPAKKMNFAFDDDVVLLQQQAEEERLKIEPYKLNYRYIHFSCCRY